MIRVTISQSGAVNPDQLEKILKKFKVEDKFDCNDKGACVGHLDGNFINSNEYKKLTTNLAMFGFRIKKDS